MLTQDGLHLVCYTYTCMKYRGVVKGTCSEGSGRTRCNMGDEEFGRRRSKEKRWVGDHLAGPFGGWGGKLLFLPSLNHVHWP